MKRVLLDFKEIGLNFLAGIVVVGVAMLLILAVVWGAYYLKQLSPDGAERLFDIVEKVGATIATVAMVSFFGALFRGKL